MHTCIVARKHSVVEYSNPVAQEHNGGLLLAHPKGITRPRLCSQPIVFFLARPVFWWKTPTTILKRTCKRMTHSLVLQHKVHHTERASEWPVLRSVQHAALHNGPSAMAWRSSRQCLQPLGQHSLCEQYVTHVHAVLQGRHPEEPLSPHHLQRRLEACLGFLLNLQPLLPLLSEHLSFRGPPTCTTHMNEFARRRSLYPKEKLQSKCPKELDSHQRRANTRTERSGHPELYFPAAYTATLFLWTHECPDVQGEERRVKSSRISSISTGEPLLNDVCSTFPS